MIENNYPTILIKARQIESKMIQQNMNQWWIWLITPFLITNLSFANNSFEQYSTRENTTNSTFLESLDNNITGNGLSSEELNYCQKVWSCSSGPPRLCYCDNLCSVFGDCCEDKFKKTTEISFSQSAQTRQDTAYGEKFPTSAQKLSKPLAKHSYNCTYDEKVKANIYTVIGCPVEYTNKYVRKNCEQPEETDRLLHVPVSGIFPKAPENTSFVKFYNFYCAICHGLTDYHFWDVVCINRKKPSDSNKTEAIDSLEKLRNCPEIFFEVPKSETVRQCIRTKDECPANNSNHDTSTCTQGPFQPITLLRVIYKNIDCALCHHVDIRFSTCKPLGARGMGGMSKLYDINEERFQITMCDTTSIYDKSTDKCKTLYSPRFCSENNLRNDDPTIPCPDCQLVKLDENEYIRFEDSIRFEKSDLTINESLLHYLNDEVYICSKHYFSNNASQQVGQTDEIEEYITLCGVSLSMLALFLTFCVYTSFRFLRNVPGKMSINLVISMFLANVLFVLSNFEEICTAVAICMHYIYLVSFFWMNALSFDAWNTFSKSTIEGRSKHCLIYYSIYCWISPLLIVFVGIFVQFTPFDIFPSWLSPKYGLPHCWISNRWSLLIFFAAPLFLLILCNVVFYTLTIRAICRTEKFSNSLLSKKNKGMFLIYLKLCFIMGINWMFALLDTLTGITIIRYISVFLNSFQGFWVGCSYLFSKQIWRQLKKKITSLHTSRGHTQSTGTESKQTSALYLTNVKSQS